MYTMHQLEMSFILIPSSLKRCWNIRIRQNKSLFCACFIFLIPLHLIDKTASMWRHLKLKAPCFCFFIYILNDFHKPESRKIKASSVWLDYENRSLCIPGFREVLQLSSSVSEVWASVERLQAAIWTLLSRNEHWQLKAWSFPSPLH